MVTGISTGKLLVRTLLIVPCRGMLDTRGCQASCLDGGWWMVDGGWWIVAQMPQGEAKSLLDLMGNMAPSESFLARLPRKLNEQWESRRKTFESMKKP